MEFSSSPMAAILENTTLPEGDAAWSGRHQPGADQVTQLYQRGPADAGPPNLSASYVNVGMDPSHSLGCSGSPPPPQPYIRR